LRSDKIRERRRRLRIDLDSVQAHLREQQPQRAQVHADVRTELEARSHPPGTAQCLHEEVQICGQQVAALVALAVLVAELAGPESFLIGLKGHDCARVSGRTLFCCTWALRCSQEGLAASSASTSSSRNCGWRG